MFKYQHFRGPNLQSLFRRWDDILTWYETEENDFGYWYQERTNIGHLALAVYQRSGIPVQEFTCRKGKAAEHVSGRADLYVSVPNGHARNLRMNIEAKQAWCSVRFTDTSRQVLRQKLKEAIDDCRAVKDQAWKAKRGVGLLFLAPYAKTMIGSFVEDVTAESRALDAGFVAFHAPTVESMRAVTNYYSESWCPGIAAIGKYIK